MMPIVPVLNGLDMVRLRDQVLTAPVFDGVAGDYPWNRWRQFAVQAGVPEDLANIDALVGLAQERHGSLMDLPWHPMVLAMAAWQPRRRYRGPGP